MKAGSFYMYRMVRRIKVYLFFRKAPSTDSMSRTPLAYELVDAKYAFNQPKPGETIYEQPVVAQLLLKRFLAVNSKSALSKLDKEILQSAEKGSKDVGSASSALEKLLQSSSSE